VTTGVTAVPTSTGAVEPPTSTVAVSEDPTTQANTGIDNTITYGVINNDTIIEYWL